MQYKQTYVGKVSFKVDRQEDVIKNTSQNQEQVEEFQDTIHVFQERMSFLGWSQSIRASFRQDISSLLSGETMRVRSLLYIDIGMVFSSAVFGREQMLSLQYSG